MPWRDKKDREKDEWYVPFHRYYYRQVQLLPMKPLFDTNRNPFFFLVSESISPSIEKTRQLQKIEISS